MSTRPHPIRSVVLGRRALPLAAALLATAGLGAGRAGAATVARPSVGASAALGAAAAPSPPAALGAIACRSRATPGERRVSVVSTMDHLPGTYTLQVRLTLTERVVGSAPRQVRAGDLGRWVHPAVASLGRDPGDVWRLVKAVYDVPAPAAYRFRARFRWLASDGSVLARRSLRTGVCRVASSTA